MANNFQDVQQGAIELIDRIKLEVKGLDAQVLKLNDNVKKLTTSGGITPQKTVDQIKALEAEMTKLNSVIKKQTTQIENLKEARKKENVEIKATIPNLQKFKKLKDDENARNNGAIKTYSQLIAKHRQVKKALQDAIVAHGKNSREVKKATIAYDKYNRKVLQAQKATSNFARKGLKGSLRGLRNLIGAFGVLGGATMIAGFVKEVFSVTKKLQSLDFALKAVVTSQKEFARVQAFLSDISNNFGANIVTTTERYIKFLAAAKQSNVSMKDTEKIFRTVTKASGVLGLKTDELTGIYLALEQMLSKGKVTTEELRRQLGERLPGAFGIMADALGVTTQELDKMLRAGEILSADALPKFAEQLEKAYGIQSVKKIDTLVAAQERLSNEWIKFIGSLNDGGGLTKFLVGLFNNISSLISMFTRLNTVNKDYIDTIKSEKVELNSLVNRITDVNIKNKTREGLIKKLTREYPWFIKLLGKEGTSNKNIANTIREVNELYIKRIALQSQQENINKLLNKSGERAFTNVTRRIELNTKLAKINEDFKLGLDLTNKSLEERLATVKAGLQAEAEFGKSSRSNKLALNAQAEELMKLNATTTIYSGGLGNAANLSEDLRKEQELMNKMQEDMRITLDELNKLFGVNTAEIIKNKDATDGLGELIEGTASWYRRQIQLAREVRDNTALTTDEYQKQTDAIRKLENALENLIGKKEQENKIIGEAFSKEWYQKLISNLQGQLDLISKLNPKYEDLAFRLELAKKGYDGLYGDEQTKQIEKQTSALKDFFGTFQDDLFSEAGFDFLGGLLDLDEEGFTKFENLLKESEDDWAIWANSIMEVGQEAFAFLQQNQEAYFENQLYNLEKQRDVSIQFAGDSAAAREEIERQYEEKRRAIQQRQAQAEKEQAMFNIAISTAQAVVSVLAQEPGGLIKKGVAAAIVGGIGLAQLAVVAARPVPEFFRGTMNAPEGMALVDEKQPEVHTDRNGNIKSFGESGANHRWLSSGDKIYKSHDEYFEKELSNVLSVNDVLPYREALSTSSPVINVSNGLKKEVFVREIRSMRNDLMSKETSVTRIDKNGFYTGVRKNGAEIERQNNILKLKGGIV